MPGHGVGGRCTPITRKLNPESNHLLTKITIKLINFNLKFYLRHILKKK